MDMLKTMLASEIYAENEKENLSFNPISSYLNYLDKQQSRHTMWWFINLMVQGNLVLWIPAWLVYYYNAPAFIVGITVGGFFVSLIANMSGAGIRVTLTTFYLTLLIHIMMVLIYVF